MKLLAFAVFDSKAEAFLRPFFAETKGLAIRSFSAAVNDSSSDIAKWPGDYTLFLIGGYDQVTGHLLAADPVSMGNALTFKVAV